MNQSSKTTRTKHIVAGNMSEPAGVSSVKLTNSSVDENRAALLGSASWNGADAYKIGDELYERATAFFAAVKWDVLASISSSLRNGIPCEFGEKFSIGHFNMVQRIVFADGISWVARLRLPLLKAVFGVREALDNASTLKVEIASNTASPLNRARVEPSKSGRERLKWAE
jgi:hypothetical protein